jgi:hypothetical protein
VFHTRFSFEKNVDALPQVVPPRILKAVIPGGGWANQPSLVPPKQRTEGEGRVREASAALNLLFLQSSAPRRSTAASGEADDG